MRCVNKFSDKTSVMWPGEHRIPGNCFVYISDGGDLVSFRLHYIKKLTKHHQKDVVLLKSRLDMYNDGWRTAQPDAKIRPAVLPKTTATNNKAMVSSGNVSVRGNAGVAAPITKRKRSSQTAATTKRQSTGSRVNPEVWKTNAFQMDDWSTPDRTNIKIEDFN